MGIGTFYSSTFNGDISRWHVGNVGTMYGMFGKAYLFNGDISEWDTSWVYSMAAMFTGAYSFNGDISNWDTSSVSHTIFI